MKNKDIFTFRDAEKQAGPVAFSTMLKPAGSACNLDCHYCYYLDKAVQYGGRQAVMSDELLELYVKQYIEANEVPTVQFCWHGGEPLLERIVAEKGSEIHAPSSVPQNLLQYIIP